jgi:hypothetical protein
MRPSLSSVASGTAAAGSESPRSAEVNRVRIVRVLTAARSLPGSERVMVLNHAGLSLLSET